jgi:Domain of unknown function (DUF4157)
VHVSSAPGRLGAVAFTTGSDIYFAPGRYEPGSPEGLRLLGHELAHVVQQRQGRVRNPHGHGVAVVKDPELEAEADRMGRALQTARPRPARVERAVVQRSKISFVRRGVAYSVEEEIRRRQDEDIDVTWVTSTYGTVVQVNQPKLWSNWQPSQKQNLYRPAVDGYKKRMREGEPIEAIAFETIIYAEDGSVYVRTLDGRHRLTAAHELGLPTVGVLDTPALQEALMLGLV